MNTFMDQLTSTNSTLAESILTEAARAEDCRKFFAKVDFSKSSGKQVVEVPLAMDSFISEITVHFEHQDTEEITAGDDRKLKQAFGTNYKLNVGDEYEYYKVDITYEFYGTNKDITVEYSGYFDSKSKTMMLETNKGLFILA